MKSISAISKANACIPISPFKIEVGSSNEINFITPAMSAIANAILIIVPPNFTALPPASRFAAPISIAMIVNISITVIPIIRSAGSINEISLIRRSIIPIATTIFFTVLPNLTALPPAIRFAIPI